MSNTKIIAVAGGFYFFGTEEKANEGYIKLSNYAMFGGFSGGKGLPGVARGDNDAKVTLDFFDKDQVGEFPVNNVYAVMDSIDLSKFNGTTIR